LINNAFELVVTIKKLFDTHLAELVSFYQDDFRDRRCLLTIFIGLDMLSKLRHNSAQLKMKLAKITVSL
jgi:hypothetical protein